MEGRSGGWSNQDARGGQDRWDEERYRTSERGWSDAQESTWRDERPGYIEGQSAGYRGQGYGNPGGQGPRGGHGGQTFGNPVGYGAPGAFGNPSFGPPGGHGGQSFGSQGYVHPGQGGGFGHPGFGGSQGYGPQGNESFGSPGHGRGPQGPGSSSYGNGGWQGQGNWNNPNSGSSYGMQGYGNSSGNAGYGGYGTQGGYGGDMSSRGYGGPSYGGRSQEWRPSENQDGYGSTSRDTANHLGRGPKGYRRADERIREEVAEVLARNPNLDASEIELEVRNAEVILKGSVDHREDKHLAENLVAGVFGVQDVSNQIRINRGSELPTEEASRTPATTAPGATTNRNRTSTEEESERGSGATNRTR